jgi:lipoprotein-releasing system permease protein
LDPENYFVSYVPVHLDLAAILAADAAAFAVIMLLLMIPSLFISKVDPAKTVRVR